tara:strand:+ start:2348 stop:2776 length:429 start_codon:yes stop_codon:yes gene_type:complete
LLKILGINISRELLREQRLPEERLFQAIILQAFEDSLSVGEHKHDAYCKQDSYDWFTNDTKNFNNVCWFANFEPEIIRGKFNELISKKIIRYTKVQLKWLRYRWLYKQYRATIDKDTRRKILKEIKSIEGLKKAPEDNKKKQ